MIQMRSALWGMLFSGVIMHMICSTNINIAITSMMKPQASEAARQSFTAYECESGVPHSTNLSVPTNETIISAPTDGEFNWTQTEKSLILSSVTWFMGVAKLSGGVLCHRYGAKRVFGYSKLAVAFLSCLVPLAAQTGVYALVTIRVLQGIAAGTSLGTASSMLISKWVPPEQRAKYASTMAGMFGGISISYFVNGWILHWFGWRTVFYASSGVTIVWCILWYFIVYETPREHPYISTEELDYIEDSISATVSKKKLKVPWLAILNSVAFWANVIASLGVSWMNYTFILYLPTYFREVYGLPSYLVGELSSIPYFLQTLFSIAFAAFADYLLKKKYMSVTAVRKFATFFTLIVAGIAMSLMPFSGCNLVLSLGFLSFAAMMSGTSLAGIGPNLVDISPNFTAILNGVEGLFTSNMGFVAPVLTGYFLKNSATRLSAWNMIFLLTCGINIIPGIIFMVFGDGNTQPWNFEKEEEREEGKKDDVQSVHSTATVGTIN